MAEEKKKPGRLARAQAQAQARSKKKKGNFFKETWSELKKVHWPTKQTVVKYTLVVLVFVLIMGVLVWCVDKVFDFGVSSLIDREVAAQEETVDSTATDDAASSTDAGTTDTGTDDANAGTSETDGGSTGDAAETTADTQETTENN